MNVRSFWLVNSKGEKYDLLNKTHFLYLPNGLGFQKSYTATRLGNSEKITDEFFKMVDVNGELLFNGVSNEYKYQAYDEFIDFAKFKPLELHYRTPNKVYGYYADIVITSIQKSEISEDGILHCPITIHRNTQWKNDNVTRLAFVKETDSSGKHYNYTYPYHYASTSLSNIQNIVNNGTEDCPIVFEIIGEVTNPVFTLIQNNVPYAKIMLNGTFSYVRINSDELEESIYLEDENGASISMPMNYQDPSLAGSGLVFTFIKIKVGENTATFTCGNIETFDGVVKITYEEKRAGA